MDELREKIAGELAKIPKGYVGITDPEWHARRLNAARVQADQILALIDPEAIREEVEKAKADIANLNKKLDDREADLINARKQERERIINWMSEPCPHTGGLEEQQMYKSDCPKCWQALKNERLP